MWLETAASTAPWNTEWGQQPGQSPALRGVCTCLYGRLVVCARRRRRRHIGSALVHQDSADLQLPPGVKLPQLLHRFRQVDLVGVPVPLLHTHTHKMLENKGAHMQNKTQSGHRTDVKVGLWHQAEESILESALQVAGYKVTLSYQTKRKTPNIHQVWI